MMENGVRGCRSGERTSQNGMGNITEVQKLTPFSPNGSKSKMSAGLICQTQVNGHFSGVNGEITYLAEVSVDISGIKEFWERARNRLLASWFLL